MSRNNVMRQPNETSTAATAVCTNSRKRQSSPWLSPPPIPNIRSTKEGISAGFSLGVMRRRSSARPSNISTVPPASITHSLPD